MIVATIGSRGWYGTDATERPENRHLFESRPRTVVADEMSRRTPSWSARHRWRAAAATMAGGAAGDDGGDECSEHPDACVGATICIDGFCEPAFNREYSITDVEAPTTDPDGLGRRSGAPTCSEPTTEPRARLAPPVMRESASPSAVAAPAAKARDR
jgi:hypothetical protein